MQKTTATTVSGYNKLQSKTTKEICVFLQTNIDTFLKKSESKIWHGSPVWFIDGNPIVSYSVRKDGRVSLMFFSGQSFEEADLKSEGKFKAAEIFYTDVTEIKITNLKRWLKKATNIQWDYKNIVKRKGVLKKIQEHMKTIKKSVQKVVTKKPVKSAASKVASKAVKKPATLRLSIVGTAAPAFKALDQHGEAHTLSEYRGSWVLMYFYPKDDTPGCTKEACLLRDGFPFFEGLKAVVLGVSIDSVKSHLKFAEKYQLPFTLLADEDKKIVTAYGVWGEKKFMGRTYMGTKRMSFLINPKGKIVKVYPDVNPTKHADEVMADLKAFAG